MNLSNSSYISVSTPYENNEFTIAKLEMEGEGLSADTYDWTSCLIVYNKNINRILSLNPFGCTTVFVNIVVTQFNINRLKPHWH